MLGAPGTFHSRTPEAGVTLVEMLVALVLSSLIGLAGFAMLDGIVRASGRAETELQRVAELDRGLLVLGRDLMQSDAGSLRIEGADLELARGDGVGRLSYSLSDDTLMRRIGTPPIDQSLIGDVASASWRVVDADHNWYESWPAEGRADDTNRALLGLEIRLTLSDRNSRELTRLYELPAGL